MSAELKEKTLGLHKEEVLVGLFTYSDWEKLGRQRILHKKKEF